MFCEFSGTEEECAPLKWVIDVTVAYPEPHKPLDLLAICAASRPPCITHLYYRRYAITDVECKTMESLRDWVYDRWIEKEELLNEFYHTGMFPHLPESQRIKEKSTDSLQNTGIPRPITMSELQIVFLHVFFISSSLFHCYLLHKIWNFIHT